MKTKLKSLAVAAMLACGLLTGCTTTKAPATPETDAAKVARVATVAEVAAFTGSMAYIAENPEARAYFVASREALRLVLSDPSKPVTPESFANALKGLPVKELSGPNGSLAIGSALILYDAFAREHVNLDANIWLRPIMAAVERGLSRGLGE